MSQAVPELSNWRPIASYAAASAGNQMLWLTFTPITTDAAHHYAVSQSAIGWLAEIFPLVYVLLALPTGRLIDRNPRGWLAGGAALTAIGAVLRLGGPSYGWLLVGQVLVALAQPLILNAVTKLPASYLRPTDRPAGIAVSSAGIFAGMVAALLLGAAFGAAHVDGLLRVQAILAVAAAIWLGAELRRPGTHTAGASTAGGLAGVWADRYLRSLTMLVCLGFGVFIALTTWLQALLKPAGVSSSAAGVLLLVMVLAGVAGSAVLPPMLARRDAQLRFVAASVIGGALACVLLAAAPGMATGIPAAVVLGVLLLTDLPIILELAERRAGPAGGTATALLWLAGNGAGLIAALAVGALDHHPGYAFALLAVTLAAGTPVVRSLAGRPAHASDPSGTPS